LKPSVRLGLLAVFIVLAAALGATTQFVDVGVAQAQTKDCTRHGLFGDAG
jgi:predicted anti-sigma-YlaC factor YlaD